MEYDTAYWKHFFETDIGLRKAEIITTYAEKFESQGITKKILLEDITEVDLRELDIAMGHRKLIIRHINEHQKNLTAPNATPPSNQTSPISSPPKKKSKKDEFLETIKDKGRDIIVGEAVSIITYLENENNTMEKLNKEYAQKLQRLENIMKVHESIIHLERRFFPLWLLHLDCSRKWKWVICLKFGLSVNSRILRTRIGNIAQADEDIAKTIVKVYREASETCHPNPNIDGQIIFTEEDWNELFEKFHLEMEDERRHIRALFSPMSGNEKKRHTYKLRSNVSDYVFEVEFIASKKIDLSLIKRILGENGRFIMDAVFERNIRSTPTNRVFIFFKQITLKTLNEIKKSLDVEILKSVIRYEEKEAYDEKD